MIRRRASIPGHCLIRFGLKNTTLIQIFIQNEPLHKLHHEVCFVSLCFSGEKNCGLIGLPDVVVLLAHIFYQLKHQLTNYTPVYTIKFYHFPYFVELTEKNLYNYPFRYAVSNKNTHLADFETCVFRGYFRNHLSYKKILQIYLRPCLKSFQMKK